MRYEIGAAEERLDNWAAGVRARAEQAAALSRRVATLTGSAASRDGSIRVTIGSSGRLGTLEPADRELARQIMSALRRAQSSLTGKVAAEVPATVAADTGTGRAVIHSFETRRPRPADDGSTGRAR